MDLNAFSRRTFVVAAATAAAALPAPAPAQTVSPPAPSAAQMAETRRIGAVVPFRFDMAAFTAICNRPYAHRQVVVTTSSQSVFAALVHMKNSLEAYADPLGFAAGPNGLHVACVMYGGNSPYVALDDSLYAKYPIAVLVERSTHPGQTAPSDFARNTKTNVAARAIGELVSEHGTSFFVCNNALSGLAYDVAHEIAAGGSPTREEVVAVHDDMAAHLLPGAFLVPAGVAALNAVQEAHFTFLPG